MYHVVTLQINSAVHRHRAYRSTIVATNVEIKLGVHSIFSRGSRTMKIEKGNNFFDTFPSTCRFFFPSWNRAVIENYKTRRECMVPFACAAGALTLKTIVLGISVRV